MAKYPLIEDIIWFYSLGKKSVYPYQVFLDFKSYWIKNLGQKNKPENSYYTLQSITKSVIKLKKKGWFLSKGIKIVNERKQYTYVASLQPILNKHKLEEKNEINNFKKWVLKYHKIFNLIALINTISKKEKVFASNKKDLFSNYGLLNLLKSAEKMKIKSKIIKKAYLIYKELLNEAEKIVFNVTIEEFYKSKEDFIKEYKNMINCEV